MRHTEVGIDSPAIVKAVSQVCIGDEFSQPRLAVQHLLRKSFAGETSFDLNES